MTLADTSVWIGHFRGMPGLDGLLFNNLVLVHPFVIGELACGNLKDRTRLLSSLQALPQAKRATDYEVLALIEDRKLSGRGIGWIDAHLLASALLANCRLWTLDQRLHAAAAHLRLT
jgi:predicted nucleic acid-binding protein